VFSSVAVTVSVAVGEAVAVSEAVTVMVLVAVTVAVAGIVEVVLAVNVAVAGNGSFRSEAKRIDSGLMKKTMAAPTTIDAIATPMRITVV
jgi:hypothetical protein